MRREEGGTETTTTRKIDILEKMDNKAKKYITRIW